MKIPSMLMKLFIAGVTLSGIAVIWAGWGTSPAGAADHFDRRGFGMVTLNPRTDCASQRLFAENQREPTG